MKICLSVLIDRLSDILDTWISINCYGCMSTSQVMGRRSKFRFKRSTWRRVRSKEKGSDESDEDYNVGRDELLDESDEYCSLDGDESEDCLGKFEEEDEVKVKKVARSKAKRSLPNRRANGIKKPRKKKRIVYKQEYDDDDEDDDDDEEFTLDEINGVDDEHEMTEIKKNKKVANTLLRENGVARGRKGKRKRKRNSNLVKKSMGKKSRKRRIVRKTRSGNVGGFKDKKVAVEEKSKKNSGKRKRGFMGDSDSDFVSSGLSDYEYTISEEEREQVREASKFCTSLAIGLRSSSSSKKVQQEEPTSHKRKHQGRKGKEKVEDLNVEVGNQVCGICLSEEGKKTVRGKLNCCSHYFCFPCIMEWSKVESRCPLCKQRFVTISKTARLNTGFDLRTVAIRVPERNQVYRPSEEEISGYVDPYGSVICNECHQGGDDALMLLCDLCDSPAHTYCVGLRHEVPEGNWFCEACRPAAFSSGNSQGPNSTQNQVTTNNLCGVASPVHNLGEGVDFNSLFVPDSPLTQETGAGSSTRHADRDFRPASPTSPAFTVLDRRRIYSQIRDIINNRSSHLGSRSNGISATNSRLGSLGSQLVPGREIAPQTSTLPERVSPQCTFSENRLQDNSPPLVRNRDRFSSGPSDFSSQYGILQAPNAVMDVGSTSSYVPRHPRSRRLNIGSDASASSRVCIEASQLNGEKEQVQQMVRKHLKALSRGNELGYNTFKDVARSSTHTVLAACGLEHRANEVYPVQPPSLCNHVEQLAGARASLMKDFCSDCFNSFVGYVVETIVSARISPMVRD
ncbi:hypothetical protein LguiA_026630 [Lonicera macranthoides]